MPPDAERPDAEAFGAFVAQHQRLLYKIANGYCRKPADREDLLQEMVVALWQAMPRFVLDPGRGKASTFVYRVALNVAISFYRRERVRERGRVELPATFDLAEADRAFEAAPEELRRLHAAIGALPELDRALVLLYLDEQPHEEIAAALGISVSNVSTRLSRIKQKLKEQMT